MVTVHKMPPKNQFLTGSGWEYDKFSYQNEPQTITRLEFNRNCLFVEYTQESIQRLTTSSPGAGILYHPSITPVEKLNPHHGDFEYFRSDFEIETSKSNKFL
jgi:hypothetical protein